MSERTEESEDSDGLIKDTFDEDTLTQLSSLIASGRGVRMDETPAFNMRLIAEVRRRLSLLFTTVRSMHIAILSSAFM
ncbi:hypothetical protein OESDEN_02602 [Oesophagostomum dentatum]|uniref:Uncharacterized protein n=1 Tax=Oesophagostomum dentatum TaxID=61180 RepID=A0A0B1TMU0_OESDE|nr:hypothetical protein OESDEN_02602 [Oesophagostomum dentatum]